MDFRFAIIMYIHLYYKATNNFTNLYLCEMFRELNLIL